MTISIPGAKKDRHVFPGAGLEPQLQGQRPLNWDPELHALFCAITRQLLPRQQQLSLLWLEAGPTLESGPGEALNEYPVTFEWPAFRERQAMMIEAVQLIRSLWTGEKVDFQGCYYRTKQAKLYTLPKNEIPIYISSLVPESAYLAGYYGDGLITVGGSLEIPEYERMLSEVRRGGATDAGRDFEKMPKAVELFVEYTDDTEKVVESFKKYWAGAMIPALFLNKIYTPAMSAQNGKVVGRDTIQKSVCISGDPEKHIEYVKQYIDAGFTHFYFHSAAGGDQIDFLERYGKDVLPALKKMG